MRKQARSTKPNTPARSAPAVRDPLAGRLVVRRLEAFRIIGCGETTGHRLINEGRLRVKKIDGMTLVFTDSIRELLELPAAAAPAP